MAENIDMNKITTEIDEVYNDSSKHVTFDEQGNSINYGSNIKDKNDQSAVEYTVPTDSLNKPDHGHDDVSEASKNTQNITAPGVPYALSYNSNETKLDIEDYEKYERRNTVPKVKPGNVTVDHKTTQSGDAYAVPHKAGAKQSNVGGDEDDDKYIDQTEGAGNYAVPDPDGGQIYNAYETLNPVQKSPSHTANTEQARIPHLNGEYFQSKQTRVTLLCSA